VTELRVSVILPCFEEAAGLPDLVTAVERALGDSGVAFEIVVVASESGMDGTVDVARALAAERAAVRVVVQPRDDPGYGRALALGIAAAREPWALLLDADGQLDPREADRLLRHTATSDVVVGYRSPRRDPLGRRVAGAVYSGVLRAVTGLRVRDFDCGFKLVRLELLRGTRIESRTGVANAEILTTASRAGGRIVEVAVTHAPRRQGTARFESALGLPSAREASRMARETLRLGLRLVRRRNGVR